VRAEGGTEPAAGRIRIGGELKEHLRVRPVRLNFDSEHEAQQLPPLTACRDRC